jgi:hypothetical protein
LKIENNKKAKEFQGLKIEFIKLEEDNFKNVKIIEEVLNESKKFKNANFEANDAELNFDNNENIFMSNDNYIRMREVKL